MENTSPRESVSHLVVTWILMIPLFYFASGGTLWFQSAAKNGAINATSFGSVTSGQQTGRTMIIGAIVFSVLALIIFPKILGMRGVLRRNSVFPIMAIVAAASSLWSQAPLYSLAYSVCLAFSTLFAFYLWKCYTPRKLFRLLAIIGWICLVFTIVLAVFFPEYGRDYGVAGAWRGIYGQKNSCSPMTVYFMSCALFSEARSLSSKIWRFAFLALSTVVVLMSQSRGGWILLATLLVYYFGVQLIKRLQPRDRKFVIVLETAIVLMVLVSFAVFFGSILAWIGKDASLTGRTDIWKAVIVSAMKRPLLGYGYLAFWRGAQGESANVSLASGWIVTGAHNGFLNIWLTLGVVGLAPIIYAFFKSFKDGVLSLQEGSSVRLAGTSASFCSLLCIVWTKRKRWRPPI